MSTRRITYYFGRLNILANFDNKNKFVLDALRSPKIFPHRQSAWGFFDIQLHEREQYCSGWLVKYKPSAIEEIAVPERHTLGDHLIPNLVTAKARFFMHLKSGLIAFHPVTPDIPQDIFRERFCLCVENAYDGILVSAEITLVEDEYEILEALKSFSSIKQVDVRLHPSNPSNRDMWKRVDERLRNLKATNYVEHYETNAPDGSLDVKEDEEIRSKITMAVDGYGKASVSGIVDGKAKTITSEDNPITEDAPNDEIDAKFVLDGLLDVFKKIMSRFEK